MDFPIGRCKKTLIISLVSRKQVIPEVRSYKQIFMCDLSWSNLSLERSVKKGLLNAVGEVNRVESSLKGISVLSYAITGGMTAASVVISTDTSQVVVITSWRQTMNVPKCAKMCIRHNIPALMNNYIVRLYRYVIVVTKIGTRRTSKAQSIVMY